MSNELELAWVHNGKQIEMHWNYIEKHKYWRIIKNNFVFKCEVEISRCLLANRLRVLFIRKFSPEQNIPDVNFDEILIETYPNKLKIRSR